MSARLRRGGAMTSYGGRDHAPAPPRPFQPVYFCALSLRGGGRTANWTLSGISGASTVSTNFLATLTPTSSLLLLSVIRRGC